MVLTRKVSLSGSISPRGIAAKCTTASGGDGGLPLSKRSKPKWVVRALKAWPLSVRSAIRVLMSECSDGVRSTLSRSKPLLFRCGKACRPALPVPPVNTTRLAVIGFSFPYLIEWLECTKDTADTLYPEIVADEGRPGTHGGRRDRAHRRADVTLSAPPPPPRSPPAPGSTPRRLPPRARPQPPSRP